MFGISGPQLLGVGSSLLGGFLNRKSQDKANAANQLMNKQSLDFAKRQFETSIQTRVKDARAAGVHPLFALGAPGSSVSFSTTPVQSEDGFARGIARAGQAVANVRKPSALQNQLLQSQINQTNAAARRDNASALVSEGEAMRTRQAMATQNTAAQMFTDELPQGVSNMFPAAPAARTTPYKRKRPSPPQPIPTAVVPVRMPDGSTRYLPNPDLGMDELTSPAYLEYFGHMLSDLPAAFRELFIGRSGNQMKAKRRRRPRRKMPGMPGQRRY